VRNNPVNFNDPTGHKEACGIDLDEVCSHNYPTPAPSPNPGPGDDSFLQMPKLDFNNTLSPVSDDQISNLQLLRDMLPFSGEDVCNYMLQDDVACGFNDWDSLVDPYNPYSIPGTINSLPGIGWDKSRVPWLTIYVDTIGIVGDIIPILQPAAEGTELLDFVKNISRTHQGLGLGFDEIDVLRGNVLKEDVKPDWVNNVFDVASLVPEIGLFGSSAGLLYNFGKGFYLYDRKASLYGPPSP